MVREEEDGVLFAVSEVLVALGGGIGGCGPLEAEGGATPGTSFLVAVFTVELRDIREEVLEVGVTMGLLTMKSVPVNDLAFGVSNEVFDDDDDVVVVVEDEVDDDDEDDDDTGLPVVDFLAITLLAWRSSLAFCDAAIKFFLAAAAAETDASELPSCEVEEEARLEEETVLDIVLLAALVTED